MTAETTRAHTHLRLRLPDGDAASIERDILRYLNYTLGRD